MSEGKSPHQPPPGAGASSTALDRAVHRPEWADAAAQVLSAAAEKAAERVLGQLDSHVTRVGVGVADEDLLGAPLPAAASEAALERGALAPMSRERDRTSLKDLARLAGPPAPSSSSFSGAIFGTPLPNPESEPEIREENSGMINLAALAAGDAGPASTVPPSTVGTSRSTSRPVYDREVMSTLRWADAMALGFPAPTVPPTRPALNERRERRSWIVAGGIVAAAAVAAGLFVGFRSAPGVAGAPVRGRPAGIPCCNGVSEACGGRRGEARDGAGGNGRPGGRPAHAAAGRRDRQWGDRGETRDRHLWPCHGDRRNRGQCRCGRRRRLQPSLRPLRWAPIPGAEQPPAPAVKRPEPRSPDVQQGRRVHRHAGSSPATATGDAPPIAPGSVPLKPSQGAIQGALRRRRSRPRAPASTPTTRMLPRQRSPSSSRSGEVSRAWSISGGASGKPAEGCVRGALMKARVTPFAQPTFTSSTTVRPN